MSPAACPSLDDAPRAEPRIERPLARSARPLAGGRLSNGRQPRRSAGALRLPFWRTTIASAAIIGILVAFAREAADQAAMRILPASPRPAAPAPPSWRPLPGAAPLYALDGARFTVRIHPELGREDVGVLGAFAENEPHLHLAIGRGPARTSSGLFVDIARRAATVGIGVARVGAAEPLATKLGPLDAAEATLVGEGERACLAFRSPDTESGIRLSGWLCGAEPARLSCLIDGLALTPAADDPALRQAFAQAEGRRSGACAPPQTVAALPSVERIPATLFAEASEPIETRPPARVRRR